MNKIDCKVFKPDGVKQSRAMIESIEEMNAWREANPAMRVINIETIMDASGGQHQDVGLRATGVRVWYEATE